MSHTQVVIVIAIALLAVMVVAVKSRKTMLKNILLSIVSAGYCLLALEVAFYFIPKTNNYGKTLGTEVWRRYYWRTNSGGFRDEEWVQKDSTKKKIAFIGDSFTAGYGIDNPDNRFSNLVATALQDSFEFYNLAVTGSNTDIKTEMLSTVNIKPDVVIYQYFVDDIVDTRIRFDHTRPTPNPYKDYPQPVTFIIQNSYLINYLYWEFPHFIINYYQNYLASCYNNPLLATEHRKAISNLIAYTRAHNIRLVFLVIPWTPLYNYSNHLTQNIEQLVSDSAITTINITPALDTIPANEIMVNRHDLHLNERGNRLVADIILEKVFGIKPEANP